MQQTRRITRTRLRRSDPGITARATVIKVQRGEDSTSRQLTYQDEWATLAVGSDFILPTPYPVGALYSMIEESSILRPCIDAYVTNTVGTGWEIVPAVRGGKMNAGEANELQSFADNANSEESLCAVMSKVVEDREAVGFGFLEGIRDAAGRIALLRHAPSLYTRLGHKHEQEVLVSYSIQRGRRVTTVREFRKFRKFIQLVAGKYVYFREWGDPRRMDRTNGKFEGEPGYQPGRDATEILHFKLPSNDPYGVPRWISQLPSVLGAREAEEVNMRYFQDNTVPPMMLTVSGGRLTKSSYTELTKMLSAENIGRDRQNKIMLIEAVGDTDSLDKNGSPVQLRVEKLADQRQSDGLFAQYDTSNQDKVRQSWRLPGILVGKNSDSNYANAQVSVFLADSQVFGPGRDEIDEVLNKRVVFSESALGMKSVKLIGRVPTISSPENTIKTLTALNVMGGVTPRSAQLVANSVLQMELPPYPQPGEDGYEEWMDKPIALSRTGAATTHAEQDEKTDEIKGIEEDGNVGLRRPENGKEGEVLKDE